MTAIRLRARAKQKRDMAASVRRVGPGMSIAKDREMMQQHATDLDAEADGLEARATALEGPTSN